MILCELKERLAERVDEITLMELLNITSEDLVNAFEDRIIEKFEELNEEYED